MWMNLLFAVGSSVVSALLRPPPPEPPSSDIEDFAIPVAAEGSEIGEVYGTVWITPRIVWYGHFRKKKIKSKGSGKK